MKGTSAVDRRANSAVKCKEFKLEREEMKAEREKPYGREDDRRRRR